MERSAERRGERRAKNAVDEGTARQQLEAELTRLESMISELRVLFEQHFVDIQPQPPTELQKETVRTIRKLLRAPFKSSATKFRLRTVVNRYQTYATYWERVQKQREDGTYSRDVFRAELKEKVQDEALKENTREGKAELGMKQLFSSYTDALRKSGINADKIDFNTFKSNLLERARQFKTQHGVTKLSYKVVVKDGKVTVKAVPKEK